MHGCHQISTPGHIIWSVSASFSGSSNIDWGHTSTKLQSTNSTATIPPLCPSKHPQRSHVNVRQLTCCLHRHISTPPPYHTHHQTNSCFIYSFKAGQDCLTKHVWLPRVSSACLAPCYYYSSSDDRWHTGAQSCWHACSSSRHETDTFCLFVFHFLSLHTPLCYLCQATSREARPQDSQNSKRSSTRQRWIPAKIPMDSLRGSEASVHVCRTGPLIFLHYTVSCGLVNVSHSSKRFWLIKQLQQPHKQQSDTNLLRTWASASRIHLLWRKLRHRMRNEKSHR